MNIARLEKLRDFIRDEVPPEKFDMSWYVSGRERGRTVRATLRDCGTTACIAGWAAALFYHRRIGDEFSFFDFAQVALDLTHTQASRLFVPNGNFQSSNTTRAQAANTLTRLIETGEVRWRR